MKYLSICLILPLSSLAFISFSATITVCAAGCDHISISAAISAANAGDIIDIQDAIHTEANIEIDKNLTIQGQGQTTTIVQANAVQANAEDGVFKILTGGLIVTFQNMTIQNGYAIDNLGASTLDLGGAVYIRCNANSNTHFNNVTITNNKAEGDRGGGIYITDDGSGQGTVQLTNCLIDNNEATGSGGDGGGIANRGADIFTMINCTVSNNIAGDDGGGLYVFEDGSTNKFINCTVYNNTAGSSSADEGRAGGFYLSGTANFDFYNCTVVNNTVSTTVTRLGGGIYHTSASNLSITNTIIANNSGATAGNDVYTTNSSSTFTQTSSLVEDCAEGSGNCPNFSYFGDPNLASVQTCGLHAYFPAASRSFISDNGTAPNGDIPTDDICGTVRSHTTYDIGSYDDNLTSTGQITTAGDIEDYFEVLINQLPLEGLNHYMAPSSGNLTTWTSILSNLLSNNLSSAQTNAASLDYEVILFNASTPNKTLYLLQKSATGSNYWGTYLFNPTPCREAIIQSPHPIHDNNTGRQGIYTFKHTDTRAFMLGGTHRCNSTSHSSCDGTTSSCISGTSFRLSDMSHNDNTCFQLTSNYLHDNVANTILVQLHGFEHSSGDPYVILSNGTTFSPQGGDYANNFKTALAATDGTLTFKVAHIDNWTQLIGTTNTQGRYINGENSPCNDAATSATGRFIHVEQERTKLRQDATGWAKVSTAIENTITCGMVLPVEIFDFQGQIAGAYATLSWLTYSETDNQGFAIERSLTGQDWTKIGFVDGLKNANSAQFYEFTDKTYQAQTTYYRLKQLDLDGTVTYSNIISLGTATTTSPFRIYPNPVTNGAFSLKILNDDITLVAIQLVNQLGQIVKQQRLFDKKTNIDVSDLPTGIYWVQDAHQNVNYVARIFVP